MNEPFTYQRLYFIGIGGIGMSALARFFSSRGVAVAGYDRVETPLTKELVREGMDIHYTDDIRQIPKMFRDINRKEDTLVIFTPAIPEDHKEMNFFAGNGFRLIKRSKLLGLVSQKGKNIAVAGTHGKTSISTMIAHILKTGGKDAAAFLGGISNNYHTNFLSGTGEWIVLEADEFDRSFLQLYPDIAVISATDADHLDIYGTRENLLNAFHEFASRVKKGGKIIVKTNVKTDHSVNTGVKWFTYGTEKNADYGLDHIEEEGGYYRFSVYTPGAVIDDLRLGIPGEINVENAVAAVAVATMTGVKADDIRKALMLFRGVKRRFDIRVAGKRYVYIDDYAHHPREISAMLSSVREMFPGREITGVFQPHLFTRTRDFADGFAESLDKLDKLIMLDIYPAREKPVPGVSSDMILSKMKLNRKHLLQKKELLDFIRKDPPPLLVTMGAGDIDRFVEPLEKLYRKLENGK